LQPGASHVQTYRGWQGRGSFSSPWRSEKTLARRWSRRPRRPGPKSRARPRRGPGGPGPRSAPRPRRRAAPARAPRTSRGTRPTSGPRRRRGRSRRRSPGSSSRRARRGPRRSSPRRRRGGPRAGRRSRAYQARRPGRNLSKSVAAAGRRAGPGLVAVEVAAVVVASVAAVVAVGAVVLEAEAVAAIVVEPVRAARVAVPVAGAVAAAERRRERRRRRRRRARRRRRPVLRAERDRLVVVGRRVVPAAARIGAVAAAVHDRVPFVAAAKVARLAVGPVPVARDAAVAPGPDLVRSRRAPIAVHLDERNPARRSAAGDASALIVFGGRDLGEREADALAICHGVLVGPLASTGRVGVAARAPQAKHSEHDSVEHAKTLWAALLMLRSNASIAKGSSIVEDPLVYSANAHAGNIDVSVHRNIIPSRL
jgi:hypothetical protein